MGSRLAPDRGMRIEDYAIVGDTQTIALIGRTGSIDWLCFPRFDAGACFSARSTAAGSWRRAASSGA
jgi:GH15 family glucan-1,4-alpha-glucosidase